MSHGDLGISDTFEQLRIALDARAAFHERIATFGPDYESAFLAHVVATVPFYRALAARGAALRELEDFPVVDRTPMLQRPTDFLSDVFPIEQLERDHFWTKTNGTLSEKFRVLFDPAAFYDLQYFSVALAAAAVPGLFEALCDSDPAVPRIYLVRDDGAQCVLYNPAVGGAAMRYLALGRHAAADAELVEQLRAAPVTVLAGSPHVLVELARLDAAQPGTGIRPGIVFASGETLYPTYRRRLEDHFACRVLDGYCASEAGVIGFDCAHGSGLHVLTDRVIVEVETSSGELVAEGSGRFVLTSLMNWVQPFVRYRIGDRGSQRWIECACGFAGPTLTVAGRDLDAYDVPGLGRVATDELTALLDRPGVEHFQVAQRPDGGLWIRWTAAPLAPADTASQLAASLHARFGDRAVLEQTEAIAIPGGKLLRFVTTPRSASRVVASPAASKVCQ